MELQITSGLGPPECELAVEKFIDALLKEYPDLQVTGKVQGSVPGGLKSVTISSEGNLSELRGTILWICQSPLRPHHKRKNWFVSVSEVKQVPSKVTFEAKDVRFQTFRSGGPGGQNVNKVSTAARAVYVPTGRTVVCSEQRSQGQNKARALERLEESLDRQAEAVGKAIRSENRLEHSRLERGNPVRVYVGRSFKRTR
ncbi:MAG: peptide chain release factor H [Deltaproteobacteria bacterium]|nr:peptide chain release factor H [Deltaproteobacteria bacterium]